MRILIIRLSSLGDVVHTLPAVPALKGYYPGCSITWAVEEGAAELLRGYPGIDRVIVSRRKQWIGDIRSARAFPALREAGRFANELRDTVYDIILDFQGLLKSGIVAGLARGRRKIGFANAREGAALFYTDKAPAPPFHEHALQRHLALLAPLGITQAPVLFAPLFGKDDEKNLDRLLENEQVDRAAAIVCVHPCARWETKLWDPEKTAQLCHVLHAETGCRALLVGGPGERGRIEHIARLARGHAKNLAGKTTLRELAALLSRAALMVSTDSGPLHLACAAGRPAVGLFGPTAPGRTGPFGQSYAVVRKELACSPCFKRQKCPRGHHRCMKDIMVEDVFKVCCNYLTSVKREA